jgi:hypothetical protein
MQTMKRLKKKNFRVMEFTSPYWFELSAKAKPVPINADQNQGYGFALAADDSILLARDTAETSRFFPSHYCDSALQRIPICATKTFRERSYK